MLNEEEILAVMNDEFNKAMEFYVKHYGKLPNSVFNFAVHLFAAGLNTGAKIYGFRPTVAFSPTKH
jgi:hypothetical protein